MMACANVFADCGGSAESSPGCLPMKTVNRTSQVSSSTGVTAETVRLSTIPQLLVTATPKPPLMACTPLFMSSADMPGISSKAMVKSTYEIGVPNSCQVNLGMNGVLCTYLKCAKSTPFSRTYCGCSCSRSRYNVLCGYPG